jgi:hypothetical protein
MDAISMSLLLGVLASLLGGAFYYFLPSRKGKMIVVKVKERRSIKIRTGNSREQTEEKS